VIYVTKAAKTATQSKIPLEVRMTNHVLVFKSSPRVRGNSTILAEKTAEGAKDAGALVETFSLHNLDIRPCDACDVCQETGVCVLKDDMQELYPKLRAARSIVIASPVYWFTLSAQAKLFIDRWYAFETPQGSGLKGKKFGLILTYGDSDPYSSGGINAIRTFQDMMRYLKAEVVGIVYGSANHEGEVVSQPKLLEQAYKLGERLATAS
jgi:multimeric flavodoxin WrbA